MSIHKTYYKSDNAARIYSYKPGLSSNNLPRRQDGLLTVSTPVLSFVQTSANKPSFLILTINQRGINEPVTLTTDAPEYFQLATDGRPAFLPSLTLAPVAGDTYVHVRYFSASNGLHTGQLIIQHSQETKTVALEGQKTGLLPALQNNRPAVRKVTGASRSQRGLAAKYLIPLLILPVLVGIAYAVISYRSQSASELQPTASEVGRTNGNGQNTGLTSTKAQKELPAKTPKKNPLIARKSTENTGTTTDNTDKQNTPLVLPLPQPLVESSLKNSQATTQNQKTERVAAVEKAANPDIPATQKTDRQLSEKRHKNLGTGSLTTGHDTSVSELERLLNQP